MKALIEPGSWPTCNGCAFRPAALVAHEWRENGLTFDYVVCEECFCDVIQDRFLDKASNPTRELVVRRL